MIIAIDGPSGTGKSTVAKAVARRLGFSFFDTGAMYRSLAWKIIKESIHPKDSEKIIALLPQFSCEIKEGPKGEKKYVVDGCDVTEAIREPHISSVASQIAIYAEVRAHLVKIQREFGRRRSAVFEGRDMGTVVFPHADLKIFLTARPEVRAERRYRQLLTKFPDLAAELKKEEILKEIEERDRNDSTRILSPLRQAADAILIDTSEAEADEVVEKILSLKKDLKRRFAPMKLSYRIVYTLARLFFKICFRLKIYGLEHFKKGSGIIAGNHASFYDPPVLSISCPEEVHFLAKESLFRIPLLGRLIRILNTHPLSRDASDATVFRQMIQLLKEGKKLILFPEGNRTPDGEIQPLERGLAFLVQKSETTIYPAYIQGTFAAWPPTKKIPKVFGKMACVFGSPLEWSHFAEMGKKEAQEAILKETERSIKALKKWLEDGAIGSPP